MPVHPETRSAGKPVPRFRTIISIHRYAKGESIVRCKQSPAKVILIGKGCFCCNMYKPPPPLTFLASSIKANAEAKRTSRCTGFRNVGANGPSFYVMSSVCKDGWIWLLPALCFDKNNTFPIDLTGMTMERGGCAGCKYVGNQNKALSNRKLWNQKYVEREA